MLGFHYMLFCVFLPSSSSFPPPSSTQPDLTAKTNDDVGNSTQDPADGSNDHVDAPANGDGKDIEDEEDDYYGEESIVAYLNALYHIIIAKHEAPRSGRIPGLKYGNTLFDHQKHAVGATLRSLAGPLKGMILGDPQGFARPR
nr:hypothetical protein FVER53263_03896 [Fusarium verticillioides]